MYHLTCQITNVQYIKLIIAYLCCGKLLIDKNDLLDISDDIFDASKFVKSISLFPFPLGDAFLFELTIQL